MEMVSPIPPAVQQVLDVYESNLPLVKFGDLEATVLADAAEEVVLAATALERAEVALEAARVTFQEKQEILLQKAQRALAYVRVYADGDPDLAARVDQISLPRSSRRSQKTDVADGGQVAQAVAVPRRSTRRRKADLTGGLLDLAVGEAAAS